MIPIKTTCEENHSSRNGQNTVGLSVINHASTLDGKYQQGREIPCHFPAYTKIPCHFPAYTKKVFREDLVSKLDVS